MLRFPIRTYRILASALLYHNCWGYSRSTESTSTSTALARYRRSSSRPSSRIATRDPRPSSRPSTLLDYRLIPSARRYHFPSDSRVLVQHKYCTVLRFTHSCRTVRCTVLYLYSAFRCSPIFAMLSKISNNIYRNLYFRTSYMMYPPRACPDVHLLS